MASDAKITIPYHNNDKLILSPVGTGVTGVPLETSERLSQLSASMAAVSASLADLVESVIYVTNKVVITFDGSEPTLDTDTFGDCSVANVDSTHFRLTSSGDSFTSPLLVRSSYGDLNWTKEDNGNYLFELQGDYSGFEFNIVMTEES